MGSASQCAPCASATTTPSSWTRSCPSWPNAGSARRYASDHAPEALQTIVELMRSAKSEKVRLDATTTLLALAGVRPAEGVEEKAVESEQLRPAVLLNLFLGGGEQKPIRVIDGQAREVGAPVRLAGEVVRAVAKPGSGR